MSDSTTSNPQDAIEYGYCHCGCGEKTKIAPRDCKRHGYVKGKPRRFVVGHYHRQTLEERFWEKVDKSDSDGCWSWTGNTAKNGYGKIAINSKQQGTHRVAWEMQNGPIPDGLCVLHKCDNPSCVRPEHLFLGTHQDNTDDMFKKGRRHSTKGERNGQSKLTEQDVLRIRELYASRISQLKIARRYNVSRSAIQLIVSRKTWQNITHNQDP